MAYNIIGKPDTFSPAFNPMFFYMDSDNKNKEGYRYMASIFSAGTNNLIVPYVIAPRPIDGYGVCDINQSLANEVGYLVNQDNNIIVDGKQDYINYRLVFGEQYVNYNGFKSNSGITSGVWNGYTMFFSSGNTYNFVAGDSVLIQQDPGFTYSQYNGVFTVLSAGTNAIIVDVLHLGPTGNQGGTIVYADKRKESFTAVTTQTGYTAFNGAVPHQEIDTYNSNTYTLNFSTGVAGQYLTNAPQNYPVKTTNKMWLNFHQKDNGDVNRLVIETRYGTYHLYNTVSTNPSVFVVGIGPKNITQAEGLTGTTGQVQWSAVTGTSPVFKNVCWDYDFISTALGGFVNLNSNSVQSPWYGNYTNELVSFNTPNGIVEAEIINTPFPNTITLNVVYSAFTGFQSGCAFQKTDYYKLHSEDTTFTYTSEIFTFDVNYFNTRYGNITLYFLDRLGSLIPMNFELQSARSINVSNSEYKKIAGNLNLSAGKWKMPSTDRGTNVINTLVKKQVVLNANFISDAVSNYMQELISSPVIYIEEFGKLWPVTMKTSNYDILTKLNKKNIPFSVTVEYGFNDRVQNF